MKPYETEFPSGLTGLVEPDIAAIPQDVAEAGVHGLILALAAGVPLEQDPYARAKAVNFDRLLLCRMPILCGGPTGLHTIGPQDPGGLMLLRTGDGLADDVVSLRVRIGE